LEKLQFQKQVLGTSCAHGFFEEDGLPGFKTACFKSKEEANTFARRLVAAYNATRHVPVETLETDPLNLDGVEDTFNRLKASARSLQQQCDDAVRSYLQIMDTFKRLKAVNEQLLDALESLVELNERSFVTKIGKVVSTKNAMNKAHAAIAAATITEKTETPC
jgi:DNA repair ATPase RecN